ncbi:unnamed protein product [Penicillium olsonii]|nr:unnamed protein product [Penicillium olsonii]
MFSLAVFFLLVGFAHFVMGQSHVLHPPGRSDIAYHFIQTDDTYIRLTAPADIDWAVLAYRQSQPISGSRFSVMAPDTMSLFLSSSESAVYTETGSSSPECFVFKEPPSVHDGVVVTEFRCMGQHIFGELEDCTWAYEEHGQIYSSPIRITAVDMYGNDNMNDVDPVPQLVGRSALPADEATSGSSQSTSATPADMGLWMAKINKLMKIRTVHGSIMSVVFLLLYPTFASFIHLLPPSLPVVKIHAALQSVTATLTVTGFGLGIYLTREVPTKDKYHQVIGAIVIVLLVIVQPHHGNPPTQDIPQDTAQDVVGLCTPLARTLHARFGCYQRRPRASS